MVYIIFVVHEGNKIWKSVISVHFPIQTGAFTNSISNTKQHTFLLCFLKEISMLVYVKRFYENDIRKMFYICKLNKSPKSFTEHTYNFNHFGKFIWLGESSTSCCCCCFSFVGLGWENVIPIPLCFQKCSKPEHFPNSNRNFHQTQII